MNFEHIFGTPWAPQVHTQVLVHFTKDGKKFVFAPFCVSVITVGGTLDHWINHCAKVKVNAKSISSVSIFSFSNWILFLA